MNKIIGIHLVRVDSSGNIFGERDNDVETVKKILDTCEYDKSEKIMIVGVAFCWEGTEAYKELKNL